MKACNILSIQAMSSTAQERKRAFETFFPNFFKKCTLSLDEHEGNKDKHTCTNFKRQRELAEMLNIHYYSNNFNRVE